MKPVICAYTKSRAGGGGGRGGRAGRGGARDVIQAF